MGFGMIAIHRINGNNIFLVVKDSFDLSNK